MGPEKCSIEKIIYPSKSLALSALLTPNRQIGFYDPPGKHRRQVDRGSLTPSLSQNRT